MCGYFTRKQFSDLLQRLWWRSSWKNKQTNHQQQVKVVLSSWDWFIFVLLEGLFMGLSCFGWSSSLSFYLKKTVCVCFHFSYPNKYFSRCLCGCSSAQRAVRHLPLQHLPKGLLLQLASGPPHLHPHHLWGGSAVSPHQNKPQQQHNTAQRKANTGALSPWSFKQRDRGRKQRANAASCFWRGFKLVVFVILIIHHLLSLGMTRKVCK